jgi:sortase A
MTFSQKVERFALWVGVALLTVFVMVRIYSIAGKWLGLLVFQTVHSEAPGSARPVKQQQAAATGGIDFSLWSEKRIREFSESLAKHVDPPLGILSIPRIHLKVPVFNGTTEFILNRGVGRIIGTAHVGGTGNLGIAGHRDGFFRALKDVGRGDAVELQAPTAVFVYQVDNVTIVTPKDVRILEDRNVPTLTLVTCYPFYFVGDAPRRYILQCSLKKSNLFTNTDQTKAIGANSTARRSLPSSASSGTREQ